VVNILGYDTNAPSRQTANIQIRNNLIYDVSTAYTTPANPASGWFALIGNGPRDITIDHNTIDNDGNDTIVFYEATASPATTQIPGVVITNNLLRDNLYGIFGSNSQEGQLTLNTYAPGATVLRNAIAGADSRYPAGNDYPTLGQWLADFVNRAGADYRLLAASRSKSAGTDGKDIGVDLVALTSAMSASARALTPYAASALAVPNRIEAENYDHGGEGLAYHDTTVGNSSGAYRGDDVDIRATSDASGGYTVKSVRAGEWLAYSVNVVTAGTYALDLRVASAGPGGTVRLTVDGQDGGGPIVLPDTGGWNTWHTVTTTGITLTAGPHVLRLVIDANGSSGTAADINWLAIR
jgi:hypothetical protein